MMSVKSIGKYFSLVLLLIVLSSIPVYGQRHKVNLILDGAGVDIESILENDRTLVSISTLGEKLGFKIEYVDNKVNIIKDDVNILLIINSNMAMVNNEKLELDVRPLLIDNNIFVPLRFIAESMGNDVTWDGKNHNVLIGEFSQEANIKDTFIYFNEEYRYTLSFPNSWKEEAIIETKNGTLYVYDKKSAERFIQDGYKSYGPVFEVRLSDYSLTAGLTYSDDYVLDYRDGKYIEALFGSDFQFYPETLNSYKKIYEEGLRVLGSFRKINDDYEFVEDDKYNYKRQIQVLYDILENYVPENIFNRDQIFTYWKPIPNTSLLYMRNMENEDEVSIKIELDFDSEANLIRYHLKSYHYELEKNQLTQDKALKLANKFINRYNNKQIELIRTLDLYPSLYEEGMHETYGDKDGRYLVVVDLVHGFVEYYGLLGD